MRQLYFVKSLEEDFHTKLLRGKKKINFQSLNDMLRRKMIKPNTMSFGRKRRLSTTILSDNYLKTYRPQGIIFTTAEKPEYVLPCDLVLFSKAEKIVVHYYRIKNNLHEYYNHELISGFERFLFKTFNALLKTFSSPKQVWTAVNAFRKRAGCGALQKEKYRLVEYNEAVFHKPIRIVPVAIFGYRKEARTLAKKHHLPHHMSAKAFWKA
ncbi:MAG: hypothetical protein V1725_07885 [archaeon]